MPRLITAISFIVVAVLTRLLPHPPNVAPVTAIALFGAVMLDRKLALLVPLAAMALSDYFLGFHNTIIWVYGSFIAIVGIGFVLKKYPGVLTTLAASFVGSVVFFIVTNFGVWASAGGMYPHTVEGLGACYAAAIPFFRNSLLGDLAYTTMIFGLFDLARRFVPVLRPSPIQAR